MTDADHDPADRWVRAHAELGDSLHFAALVAHDPLAHLFDAWAQAARRHGCVVSITVTPLHDYPLPDEPE